MAACSLFEEDEVCHVTPDNTYVYGLVMENSETVSSDEEDSRHDVCKKGCVRVAWHPKGKESLDTPENKVLLADRSLMVADIVRRFVPGQETQCGSVQDLQVTCHLHVTGTDKYIYNVDSKHLSPCVQLQKFDNGYVTMDNWLGRVEEVTETITLQLPDGAKCEIDDSDVCYLDDISEKRPETATYNEEYWYPGQQLKGVLGNLCNVNWLSTSLLYNGKNVDHKRNSTFYCIVEKVEIRSIFVYWICRGFSKASLSPGNKLLPPCREVKGADVERLQLVDWFEHCTVKLGDKMYYTVQPEDVLETQLPKHRCAPHCVQSADQQRLAEVTRRTDDLYHQRFDETGKPRRKGSRKGGASTTSASSSNTTAVTTNSSTSNASMATGHDTTTTTTASAQDTTTAPDTIATETNNCEAMPPPGADEGGGDVEVDADDEFEDVDEDKDGDSASDAGSVSSSASGAKRRKRDKGVGMSIKSLRNASRNARRTRPVPDIPLTSGSRVATEVCYTFSRVNVIWQDGSMEEKIPSIDLFPVHHMDELEFFPGSFVIDASEPDTANEYGVVTSCNHFERTCQVKWLKPYEVGQNTCPTAVIKESEVSVYDIRDHPDYKFRPGHSVIRVAGFEDTHQTLQAVGQVMSTSPAGTVFVHWSDGTFTSSYPQDLYIVWDLSDYSNSSWGSDESSSCEDDSETDASWETEEEEEGWKEDGAGDGSQSEGEEEAWDSLKSMSERRRAEVKGLMVKLQDSFGALSDFYVSAALSEPGATEASAPPPPTIPTTVTSTSTSPMDGRLAGVLKKTVKLFRACRRLDKSLKTAFFSSPPLLNLLASIKFHLKNERSNKIKQHLEHVFESNNKGLLQGGVKGGQKEEEEFAVAAAAEAAAVAVAAEMSLSGTMAHKLSLGGGGSDASCASLGSPSKKLKTGEEEDGGSSVDDVGSSVDLLNSHGDTPTLNGASPPAPPGEQERDIASWLAATNVGEGKPVAVPSNGESSLPKDAPPHLSNSTESRTSGIAQETPGGSASALALEKATQLCELFEKTLACIQEAILKVNEATSGSRRNSLANANTQAVAQPPETEAEKEKGKEAESQNGDLAIPPAPCPAEEDGEVVGGWAPDTATDQQDGGQAPQLTAPDPDSLPLLNGKEEEEVDIQDPPGLKLPNGFFMCGAAPDCHSYIARTCLPSVPKTFNAALRRELKLLRTSLPDGILIKGFEDRMDLFSVLIEGPSSTPYEDGVFLFDVMLPHDYPLSPPLFHYLSYCADRLNPNLYADGKVCVSLLGTWSGKGMEVWTQQSNLLQVLVSIQGLILVDEPYYNEAGYEKQRGQQLALENSRVYNEMALLKLVESMTAMSGDLPRPFEEEVRERLQSNGPKMMERLRRWLALSETIGDRQHLAAGGKAEAGAEGGTTPTTITTTATIETTPSNTEATAAAAEKSAAAGDSNGATCLSENSSSACGVRVPLPPPPPPGHPHFPLLPMSKGFRLSLLKSITNFGSALHRLGQETAVLDNGALEDSPAHPIDTQSS